MRAGALSGRPDEALRCPGCGHESRALGRRGPCASCGFPCDEITHDLVGEPDESPSLLTVTVTWTAAIAVALALRLAWMVGPLATLMAAHLGYRARAGADRPRLIATVRGAAVVRGGRRPALKRWHLFDEARVEPRVASPAPDDVARWRLTLVNAYKPSISTYLHSRGTDAPIFSPCLEFDFAAPVATATSLAAELQETIATARRGYRVLALDDMHCPPPDPERLLRLQHCPRCDAGIARAGVTHCRSCGGAIDHSMFRLDATLIAPRGFRRPGAGGARPAAYPTAEGIEIWRDGDVVQRFAWKELPVLEARRMESGQWRLAMWNRPKRRIGFSPMLFRWWAVPAGEPTIDLLLDGDPRGGPIVRDEIEQRRVARAT